MDELYTLEDLSRRLENIPISTLKHRIHQLGLPAAARGSRNKLLFAPHMVEVLAAADRLIREGRGMPSVRRALALDDVAAPPRPQQPIPDPPDQAEAPPTESTRLVPAATPAAEAALDRLSRSLAQVVDQLADKDRQLEQLQQTLRQAVEAAATFQQKTFYLQGELQRLQGELREARRAAAPDVVPGLNLGMGPLPWKRLWKKDS